MIFSLSIKSDEYLIGWNLLLSEHSCAGKDDPWYLSGANWSVEVEVPEEWIGKQDFKEAVLKYSTISPHSCFRIHQADIFGDA